MANKTDYITRAGWQKLRHEADDLWRVRRPSVVRALAAAAAEGDRSENAEYIYRKKELREIDRRLRTLDGRLRRLTVAEGAPADPSRVYFGAWVTVADRSGTEYRYRIVGADESNAATGAISLHSPVARALLGRAEGDQVHADLPAGRAELEIVSVEYPAL